MRRQKRETKYRKQRHQSKKQLITANKQTNKTAKNIYFTFYVVFPNAADRAMLAADLAAGGRVRGSMCALD